MEQVPDFDHGQSYLAASAADDRLNLARSPHWEHVRAVWLHIHDTCAACGGTEKLEVHHIKVFHLHPELELDPSNFITLCEAPERHCHLIFGHLLSWHSWNESVVHDAKTMLKKIQNRPMTSAMLKESP